MQWLNDFVDWIGSEQGAALLTTVIVPFVAIVLAGIIGGVLGRGAVKRIVRQRDADYKAGIVASLVASARRASQWSTLNGEERQYAETLAGEADIRLRLLPLAGASVAADWAAHEIAELRKHSVSYSRSSEQMVTDFRDRLVEWEFRPRRARKQFVQDLERWRFEQNDTEQELEERQQAWIHERTSAARVAAAAKPAPLAPVPVEKPAPTVAAPVAEKPEEKGPSFSWTPPVKAQEPEPAPLPERKPVGENGLDEDGLSETQALEPVPAGGEKH
ncbi:hypothetical protein [Desertivibrio insolitus]|uniref:hypothetical protein n=1 Tax=Herbiconiux sp. SYSU D00978 TaxID=2812562 RepID=UPI001A97C943|nr:hypothetical protein [Herbiconiux sp. SYSU D00978]